MIDATPYEDRVIVSRHRAAIQFIADQWAGAGEEARLDIQIPCRFVRLIARAALDEAEESGWAVVDGGETVVPVLAEARAEDVRNKHVYGNVPLHLAAEAASVTAVEFAGAPPRGQEYGLADMRAAGARLVRYVVRKESGESLAKAAAHLCEEVDAVHQCIPGPGVFDALREVRRLLS